MNYKILRIIGMSHDDIYKLYQDNLDLLERSYERQREYLRNRSFLFFNNFAQCMENLGNEAVDIIYDLEYLQKAWAEEHKVDYAPDKWQTDILLEQIRYYKPDVLYCFQDIGALPDFIQKDAKSYFPFIKLFIAYRGFHGFAKELRGVDALFVATPRFRDEYRKEGIEAHLLYHAFDDSILNKLAGSERSCLPFSFIGSSGYGQGPLQYFRHWALRELIKKTNIQLWLLERKEHRKRIERGKIWFPEKFEPMVPINELAPHRCQKTVFGLDMFRILHRSKLTFNSHVEITVDCVGNMRMFEATGVGACLLTDTGRNIKDLFEPDSEVVTYSSVDECIEKVNYLLEHEAERAEIAEAGQKRTLKSHTLQKRCEELDGYIKEMLK